MGAGSYGLRESAGVRDDGLCSVRSRGRGADDDERMTTSGWRAAGSQHTHKSRMSPHGLARDIMLSAVRGVARSRAMSRDANCSDPNARQTPKARRASCVGRGLVLSTPCTVGQDAGKPSTGAVAGCHTERVRAGSSSVKSAAARTPHYRSACLARDGRAALSIDASAREPSRA